MDEPSAHTRVHLTDTYRRVIKDIENRKKFYEAKVLAISSEIKSETTAVHFGSKPTKNKSKKPWQVQGEPYMYGDTSSDDTDGSYLAYDRPETPRQRDLRMRGMWGNPPEVNGNDYYSSSVLKKDGYL